MLKNSLLTEIEDKIVVSKEPYPHTTIKNFLPVETVKKAENEFNEIAKKDDAGCVEFQKTKRVLYNYSKMPPTAKEIIDFLYSENFIKILERKFNLSNLKADWKLFGGGLHESFRGGFLKVHSDFIYMRKSKLKRVLNLLLYLNSNWNKDWGGAIELWDKKMSNCVKSLLPDLNNTIIFRTDNGSNHGFPDPMTCPQDVSRKSLALYYYVEEKSILPVSIKRRKLFHAVWKRRPKTQEPKFADNDPFFKRLKHRFFFRFF